MQSFSANPHDPRDHLLVLELWGLGDVALALPFIRAASAHARVTLVARPHAAPLVRWVAPEVDFVPLTAPWTAHRGKYRLHRWPWRELTALLRGLRRRRFTAAVSVRPDPRDHLLLALTGATMRVGFPRAGSSLFLTNALPPPADPHRSAAWAALAQRFNWTLPPGGQRLNDSQGAIVIHTGAAQPERRWPVARFTEIATRLRAAGRTVTVLDENSGGLDDLLAVLARAERFIGNDSGPGHVAALLGVPTFTVMGSSTGALFHPVHPQAAWIDGAPCPHKPCRDFCRFDRPHCIQDLAFDDVWRQLEPWLAR